MLTERDILQQMAVRDEARVYVLGCFERRITLYTQQVRALNLIHALFTEEQLKAGSKLAVIGGGAAGLTAAAGAAIRGARVTVFEETGDLLPMFRNNRQRWLHPHIYDWPEEGSEEEQANLPVLDWQADLAGNVAERLLAQWRPLAQRYGIAVHTHVQRLKILPGTIAPRQLTWNTQFFDEGEFEVVILAVGFGSERMLEGVSSPAYWDDDNLDRLLHTPSTPKRYLISGTGDGGVIDLLRVRLRDFRHERIIQRYLRDAPLGEVKTALLKLEEDFRKGKHQERDFFKKYKELPVPKQFDERLQGDLRGDTTAILNGRDAFPLSGGASILNRFLTSRLLRLGGVRYESGEPSVTRVKDAYEVAFLDESKHPKHTEEFDDIIVRHGPQPALKRSFKSLWEKAGARMRDLAELDQTRRPLFKPEHFVQSTGGTGVSTPSAPTILSATAGVPSQGDCFGREELTRQLVAAILVEVPRPTMVLGPPGIGKSTLTLQAYHHPEVLRRYGNRRYFVRLDGATSRDLMISAVAAVLGIRSEANLWEAVKHALQAAPALLILDNIETPWDVDRSGTEALLADLRDLPGLAFVCSVRGGERPYVPRGGPAIEVTRLDDEAARDLFCSIAWKVNRKEHLLTDLLREQDGLPLAIKLLAFTAEGASLENTWMLWQRERAALYERPGGTDKQSSLAASLEVSIKGPRMTEEARRLLSLLAELPGGVAQEDLDRLLPGIGLGAAQVLSKIGLAFFEQGRLRMLAPIREHVRRTRRPSAEDRERTSTYYLSLPQEHGWRIGRTGGAQASTLLITEFSNIEGFIEDELSGQNALDAVNAAIALSEFIRLSGHGTPLVLQRARDAARSRRAAAHEANCIKKLGDIALARSQHEEARRRYEETLSLYEQVGEVRGRANCIRSLGDIALARSQHEEARHRYEEALPLYKQVGDVRGRANCILSLGDIALARSQHEEARRRYEEALPLYKQVGDVLGRANCILSLGDIALARSQHEEARRRYEEALPLYEQVGDVLGRANCILRLGDIALAHSQYDEARPRYEEAHPLYKQVGAVLGRANCIKRLGDIALARSQHEEARHRYEEALPLYEQVGDVLGRANCIKSLGDIALARSQHEKAQRRYEEALPLYEQVGGVLGRANCIQRLGDIAFARSQHEEARRRYEEALPLYEQLGNESGRANCILSLGDIAFVRSQYEEAAHRYEEALPLYEQVGDVLGRANCFLSLGDIAIASSQYEEARQLFTQSISLYTRIPEPYSIGQTHRRLARIAPTAEERHSHIIAARQAWESIDRPDLVQELRDEFGDEPPGER